MSLYVKVFLWFWCALFLAMAVAVGTTNWLEHNFYRPASTTETQQLVRLIEQERPIVAEGRKLWRKMNSGWNLVSVPVDLINHLPYNLEDFVDQAGQEGLVLFGQESGWLMIGPLQQHGYLYLAVSRDQWFSLFEAQDRLLILLAILAVVTLLCFILVWNLTRPIRQLQQGVRLLATGNFDVEDMRSVRKRKDEIGMLAGEMVQMAEALKRLLLSHEQLLHDVSHELRSPLTRLQIALAIARKKDPQQSLDNEHNRIERAVNQINYLISQILDLARLQKNDASSLQMQPLPLIPNLQEWVDDAAIELEQKKIQIHWQLPAKLPAYHADWLLLERAFDNLLRNAIRFSPHASTLSVGAKREADHLLFWVQDQGPGVPEESLTSIFNPFTQVDSARDHASGGYGLGLALARRIVELHGGHIEACNQHPGLRVTIHLPIND